jgi:protein-disulfide isomerase
MKKFGLILAALAATSSFATNTFSSAQKQEINNLVEQYITNNPKVVMKSLIKFREQSIQEQNIKAKKAVVNNFKKLVKAPHSPVMGNPNGDVTLIEFLDYRCGHCREMSEVVTNLIKKDSNLKVVIKQLPIFSGDSLTAAKAALAVNSQGNFTQFHHDLLTQKAVLNKKVIDALVAKTTKDLNKVHNTMKQEWVQQEIDANMQLAKQLGLMGTPAFVIVNSTDAATNAVIPGAASMEKMTSIIKSIRN